MRASPSLETALLALLFTGFAHLTAAVPSLLPTTYASSLVLTPPLTGEPWALVTSVYTHWSLAHLVGNGLGLLLVGSIVERHTTRFRFHVFFLGTGMAAGVSEVLAGQITNTTVAVAGMSGGVLALLGYLLAGNRLTRGFLERVRLSRPVLLGMVAALVIGLTIATAGPRVALVGHAVGLLMGLIAGRRRLLSAGG